MTCARAVIEGKEEQLLKKVTKGTAEHIGLLENLPPAPRPCSGGPVSAVSCKSERLSQATYRGGDVGSQAV